MANLHVLLADSDSTFRNSAQRALTRQGYFVVPAATSNDALSHLENDDIDVIVADVALPPRDGLELLHAAKSHAPPPPVSLLTDARTIGAAATGVRQGAFDYLIKPFDDFTRLAVLIDRVAGKPLTTESPVAVEASPTLSATPGEEASARFLAASVTGQDLDALLSIYAAEFAQLAHAPQTVVLLMQENAQLHFATSHGYVDRAEAARAYVNAGGEDFAWRVVEAGQLIWETTGASGLAGSSREPQEMLGLPLRYANRVQGVAIAFALTPRETFPPAMLDALGWLTQQASLAVELAHVRTLAEHRNPLDATTGLFNRTHFFERADHEFRRSWRFGEPLAVVELDVDDFIRLTQILGPGSSEQIMQQVAAAVHPRLRSVDLLGRLDADKIGAVVVHGTREQTPKIAERLRRAVAEIELATPEGPWQVTASLGVATYPREQCTSIHDLFAFAAQATQAAKRSGRNRAVSV